VLNNSGFFFFRRGFLRAEAGCPFFSLPSFFGFVTDVKGIKRKNEIQNRADIPSLFFSRWREAPFYFVIVWLALFFSPLGGILERAEKVSPLG